eukprot:6280257-Amphidinium_carterae.2
MPCKTYLEPALRPARTRESTTRSPLCLHNPLQILLFSVDALATSPESHVCRESALPTGRNTSARGSSKRLEVAF